MHTNVSPLTCFNRLKIRKQVGDEAITLSYLEHLDDNYKGVYEQMSSNPFYRSIDLCENESPEQCLERVLKGIKEIESAE